MARKKTDKAMPAASTPDSAIRVKVPGRRPLKNTVAETSEPDPDNSVSKRERTELLAYSYWVQRGRQGGSPEEDWFRAEREINRKSSN